MFHCSIPKFHSTIPRFYYTIPMFHYTIPMLYCTIPRFHYTISRFYCTIPRYRYIISRFYYIFLGFTILFPYQASLYYFHFVHDSLETSMPFAWIYLAFWPVYPFTFISFGTQCFPLKAVSYFDTCTCPQSTFGSNLFKFLAPVTRENLYLGFLPPLQAVN